MIVAVSGHGLGDQINFQPIKIRNFSQEEVEAEKDAATDVAAAAGGPLLNKILPSLDRYEKWIRIKRKKEKRREILMNKLVALQQERNALLRNDEELGQTTITSSSYTKATTGSTHWIEADQTEPAEALPRHKQRQQRDKALLLHETRSPASEFQEAHTQEMVCVNQGNRNTINVYMQSEDIHMYYWTFTRSALLQNPSINCSE